LAVSNGAEIQVFYFRDFTAPIAVYKEQSSFISFDVNCKHLIAADQDSIKLITK